RAQESFRTSIAYGLAASKLARRTLILPPPSGPPARARRTGTGGARPCGADWCFAAFRLGLRRLVRTPLSASRAHRVLADLSGKPPEGHQHPGARRAPPDG